MLELEKELSQFIGTEYYHQHNIGNFAFTDGVKYLAEEAGAYWLLDLIGSYQLYSHVNKIRFQLWELKLDENSSAVITLKEDTDMPVIAEQKIPFTDFPLKELKLYLINNVLMLPSEY